MSKKYFDDLTFKDVDFTKEPLEIGEYDSCIFQNCRLYSCNLTDIIFANTTFLDCDLSMSKLENWTTVRRAFSMPCRPMTISAQRRTSAACVAMSG